MAPWPSSLVWSASSRVMRDPVSKNQSEPFLRNAACCCPQGLHTCTHVRSHKGAGASGMIPLMPQPASVSSRRKASVSVLVSSLTISGVWAPFCHCGASKDGLTGMKNTRLWEIPSAVKACNLVKERLFPVPTEASSLGEVPTPHFHSTQQAPTPPGAGGSNKLLGVLALPHRAVTLQGDWLASASVRCGHGAV